MSILHHFGKVKASYKKYEGDLPQYTGYVHKSGRWDYKALSLRVHDFNHLESLVREHYKRFDVYDGYGLSSTKMIFNTYQHDHSPETILFSFTTLAETFSKCFEKVREKMYSDLWKTIECCPIINIMDLLLLKQSDTDKHIEHVEQMMCSLMEDNKLLQNRINALETKRAIPVKTVGELLCES